MKIIIYLVIFQVLIGTKISHLKLHINFEIIGHVKHYLVSMIVILGQSNPLPAWIQTLIQINVHSFVEFLQGLFWNES